jgi:glycosyltransferase involved in cell wall biosynthesis
MVRVLLISAAGALGGAERSLYELAAAVPREHVAVHVCAPPGSPLLAACAGAGLDVCFAPLERFHRSLNPLTLAAEWNALKRAAAAIERLCYAHQYDVLHANTDASALVAGRVSRRTGLPFVWHCRDLRRLGRWWRLMGRSPACYVAISETVAAHLKRQGFDARKIRIVMNGIDLRRFDALDRSASRAKLGLSADQPVLLTAGAYVPWKRHELFIETLTLLRQRVPQAVGLLAGSDLFGDNVAYRQVLRGAAQKCPAGALQLLGERDDLPALLAAADVFVSCSHNEPFGRVLVEAGAAGVPVVAVNSGAKAEIIEHGVTGLLTEPTAEALAAACEKLLAGAPLRAQMAAAARERVTRLFDVRRAAEEMAGVWRGVTAG